MAVNVDENVRAGIVTMLEEAESGMATAKETYDGLLVDLESAQTDYETLANQVGILRNMLDEFDNLSAEEDEGEG